MLTVSVLIFEIPLSDIVVCKEGNESVPIWNGKTGKVTVLFSRDNDLTWNKYFASISSPFPSPSPTISIKCSQFSILFPLFWKTNCNNISPSFITIKRFKAVTSANSQSTSVNISGLPQKWLPCCPHLHAPESRLLKGTLPWSRSAGIYLARTWCCRLE